jgi:hypothetical protein
MVPVYWDVLSVVVQVLLHYQVGPQFAWAAVFLLVSLCSVDRDMAVHEMFAAVFMLRSACDSLIVRGYAAWVMAALVVCGSVGARADSYLTQPHMFRRPFSCTMAACSVMLRYQWNVTPAVAVMHLALFNAISRCRIVYRAMDSWDAAAQSLWILALPTNVCVIGFLLMLAEGKVVIGAHSAQRTIRTYQGTDAADTLV